MSALYVAAVLAVVVLVASMFSVELGLSVAIIEIVAGAVVGNTLHLTSPEWLVFLAGFGSVVLTFLAGAEVDPAHMRAHWRPSVLIGALSFVVPFIGVMLACRYGFGWDWQATQIGGIALSTTSLAVVYAVLVETGLNATHNASSPPTQPSIPTTPCPHLSRSRRRKTPGRPGASPPDHGRHNPGVGQLDQFHVHMNASS